MNDNLEQDIKTTPEGSVTQEPGSINYVPMDGRQLSCLSEHLQKMLFLHKSSIKDCANEIRKFKRLIAVEKSRFNKK